MQSLLRKIACVTVKEFDSTLGNGAGRPCARKVAVRARLNAVFPTGVCDWSKPGVGQQEAVSPLTFAAGPGGQPLPPAPVSQPRVN